MPSTSSRRVLITSLLLLLLVSPSMGGLVNSAIKYAQAGYEKFVTKIKKPMRIDRSPTLTPEENYENTIKELKGFSTIIQQTYGDVFFHRDKKYEEAPFHISRKQLYSEPEHAVYVLRLFEECDDTFKQLDFKIKSDQVHDVLHKCLILPPSNKPLDLITSEDASELLQPKTLDSKFEEQFKELYKNTEDCTKVKRLRENIDKHSSKTQVSIDDLNIFTEEDRNDVLDLFILNYAHGVFYTNMASFNPGDAKEIPNYATSYSYFVRAMLITEPDGTVRDFGSEFGDITEYLGTVGIDSPFKFKKIKEFAQLVTVLAKAQQLTPTPIENALFVMQYFHSSAPAELSALIDPMSHYVTYEKLLQVLAENYKLVKEKRATENSLTEWIFRKFYFYALYKFYDAHKISLELLYNKTSNPSLLQRICNTLTCKDSDKLNKADLKIKGWFPGDTWRWAGGGSLSLASGAIGAYILKQFYDYLRGNHTTAAVTNATLGPITKRGPDMLPIFLWAIGGILALTLVGYYAYTRITKRDPLGLLFWIKKEPPKNSAAAGSQASGKQTELSKKQEKPKSSTTDSNTLPDSTRPGGEEKSKPKLNNDESSAAVLPPTSPESATTTEISTKKVGPKEKTQSAKAEKCPSVLAKKSHKSKEIVSSEASKQEKKAQSEAADKSESASTKKSPKKKKKRKSSSPKQKKKAQSESSDKSKSVSTKKSPKKKKKRRSSSPKEKKKAQSETADKSESTSTKKSPKKEKKRKSSSRKKKKKKSKRNTPPSESTKKEEEDEGEGEKSPTEPTRKRRSKRRRSSKRRKKKSSKRHHR